MTKILELIWAHYWQCRRVFHHIFHSPMKYNGTGLSFNTFKSLLLENNLHLCEYIFYHCLSLHMNLSDGMYPFIIHLLSLSILKYFYGLQIIHIMTFLSLVNNQLKNHVILVLGFCFP